MIDRHLNGLIKNLKNAKIMGNGNPIIKSLAWDSRKVEPNSVFFALKGIHTDGHKHIAQAIEAGATAIIHSGILETHHPGVVYIRVPDTRVALSPVSAEFWGHPSRKMKIIGVTGTDGKSTTVSLIRQLLEFTGASTGSISTVNIKVGKHHEANLLRQTTPEAPQIHGLLRDMLDANQDYAVLEASSHGLSPQNSRLADVEMDAAVFTNLTSEHLEFHGSIDNYRKDKTRLFQMIAESRNRDAFGVVNADDPHAENFIAAAGEKPIFTYSLKDKSADLFAENLVSNTSGTSFTMTTPMGSATAQINLPGLYNVENTLAALCLAAEIRNEDPLDLSHHIGKLQGIKGRMENITGNMDFDVIIDYAHSPGSFSRILPFLKKLTKGRLIIVFGSAGERDSAKRPEQGRLAAEYGDFIFLTNEDPRGEDPMAILKDISDGISTMKKGKNLFLIPDRKEAMSEALKKAKNDDLVLFLGKGHESSIILEHGSLPWNEAEFCREILQDMGYKV